MSVEPRPLVDQRGYVCRYCPHSPGLSNIDREGFEPCYPVADAYNSFFSKNPEVQLMALSPDVEHEQFVSDHRSGDGCFNMRYRLIGKDNSVIYESEPFDINPKYSARYYPEAPHRTREEERVAQLAREAADRGSIAGGLLGAAGAGYVLFQGGEFLATGAANQLDDPFRVLAGGAAGYVVSSGLASGGRSFLGKLAAGLMVAAALTIEGNEFLEYARDADIKQLADIFIVPAAGALSYSFSRLFEKDA